MTPIDAEQQRHELFLEKLRLASEHNRSPVPLVHGVTQALMVLNGGALTALLTVLGATSNGAPKMTATLLRSPLTATSVSCFVLGAILSVFVGACGYLVQIRHQRVVWMRFEDDHLCTERLEVERRIKRIRIIGFACGVASLGLFLAAAVPTAPMRNVR